MPASLAVVTSFYLGMLFSVPVAPWLVIAIHERAHAVVARKHTSAKSLTAICLGKRRICRLSVSCGRCLGLDRVEILAGRVPSGGRCGHARITSHKALLKLYAAGVKATGKAGLIAGASTWLLTKAAHLLPMAVRSVVLCIAGAVAAFAVLSLADCVGNLIPFCPKRTSTRDGSDGYVLWHLVRSSSYLPNQQTAEELLQEHGYTPR